MMHYGSFAAMVILSAALSIGCSGGTTRPERQITVDPGNDPLSMPRAALQRYASGEPIGSEATSFEFMVNNVRETDPIRADVLEQGLEELQKAPPPARPSIAKKLLKELEPSVN